MLDARDPVDAIRLKATRLAVIRRGKVIAESDDDGESDGDDAFMASMDELLKGVDVDPLDID